MGISVRSEFRSISRGSVTLRGKAYPVRGLTSEELGWVEEAFPLPVPPLKLDPTRGSKSPPVPDRYDREFQKAYSKWASVFNAGKFAVAADFVAADEVPWSAVHADPAARVKWLGAVVADVRAMLSEDEIAAGVEEVNRLSNPFSPSLQEAAEKVLILTGEELADAEGDGPEGVPWSLPKRYALTWMGLTMRALQGHGVSLAEAEKMQPGELAGMVANQRIKEAEEARAEQV